MQHLVNRIEQTFLGTVVREYAKVVGEWHHAQRKVVTLQRLLTEHVRAEKTVEDVTGVTPRSAKDRSPSSETLSRA